MLGILGISTSTLNDETLTYDTSQGRMRFRSLYLCLKVRIHTGVFGIAPSEPELGSNGKALPAVPKNARKSDAWEFGGVSYPIARERWSHIEIDSREQLEGTLVRHKLSGWVYTTREECGSWKNTCS